MSIKSCLKIIKRLKLHYDLLINVMRRNDDPMKNKCR